MRGGRCGRRRPARRMAIRAQPVLMSRTMIMHLSSLNFEPAVVIDFQPMLLLYLLVEISAFLDWLLYPSPLHGNKHGSETTYSAQISSWHQSRGNQQSAPGNSYLVWLFTQKHYSYELQELVF